MKQFMVEHMLSSKMTSLLHVYNAPCKYQAGAEHFNGQTLGLVMALHTHTGGNNDWIPRAFMSEMIFASTFQLGVPIKA